MYDVLNIRMITEKKKKILNMDTLGVKKLTQEDGRYEKCAMMQSIKPLS